MRRPSPSLIISMIALVFAMSGTAVAATGGNFILGKANTASSVSSLTNTKGTALSLSSSSTAPPLKVSNSIEVPKLNASELDGQSSRAFLGINGTAANSNELGGRPASAYLSSSPGAVGRSSLANGAVGPAQLGDDFMKRIDASTSYGNIVNIDIGSDTYVGLNCHFSSSLLRIDLVNSSLTTMDMSLVWIDSGGTSHYLAAATDFLGPDVGTATGYFVMSDAAETIAGTFEAFDNGSNTCTLEGNMYRLTTAN
jgi:hypothetical protein